MSVCFKELDRELSDNNAKSKTNKATEAIHRHYLQRYEHCFRFSIDTMDTQ